MNLDCLDITDYGATPDTPPAQLAAVIQTLANTADGTRNTILIPTIAGRAWNLGDNRIDLRTSHLTGSWIPSGSNIGACVRFDGTGGFYSTYQNGDGYSISNLQIVGSGGDTPTPNGQTLVDFTGVGKPRLTNVRLQQAGTGVLLRSGSIVECCYGLFHNVDVQRCWVGWQVEGNSHTWLSGRAWLNRTAALITPGHDNLTFCGTAFEGSSTASIDSTGNNVTCLGCRFESPGITEANLVIRPGGGPHHLHGNHWSSGVSVIDHTPGSAYGTDQALYGTGIVAASSTTNFVANPGFKTDSNGDGVADNWALTFSSNGAYNAALDPTFNVSGPAAQRVTNQTAKNLRLYQTFPVEQGVRYMVRARVFNTAGTLQMRVGSSTPGSVEYSNLGIPNGAWQTIITPFTASSPTVALSFYLNGTTPTTFWVDAVTVTPGLVAPPNWLSPADL